MATTTEDVVIAIREELATMKVPGAEDATTATTWQELDVDSLELVELVKALEDRFEIEIVDGKLKGIASVGDAAEIVVGLTSAGAAA